MCLRCWRHSPEDRISVEEAINNITRILSVAPQNTNLSNEQEIINELEAGLPSGSLPSVSLDLAPTEANSHEPMSSPFPSRKTIDNHADTSPHPVPSISLSSDILQLESWALRTPPADGPLSPDLEEDIQISIVDNGTITTDNENILEPIPETDDDRNSLSDLCDQFLLIKPPTNGIICDDVSRLCGKTTSRLSSSGSPQDWMIGASVSVDTDISRLSIFGILAPSMPTLVKREHILEQFLISEQAYASSLIFTSDVVIPLALGKFLI